MVGLVQVYVCRLVVDFVGDREVYFIVEDEGRANKEADVYLNRI